MGRGRMRGRRRRSFIGFSRLGPEIWWGLQPNKEYHELMKSRGLDSIKDMSWGDAQERTSPYWWQSSSHTLVTPLRAACDKY